MLKQNCLKPSRMASLAERELDGRDSVLVEGLARFRSAPGEAAGRANLNRMPR